MSHTESRKPSTEHLLPPLESDVSHQIIDPQERILILYRDPVQLTVIDAHTLRTVLFVDEDRRRSLRGVARSDEPRS